MNQKRILPILCIGFVAMLLMSTSIFGQTSHSETASTTNNHKIKIMPLGNSITCDNNMDQTPPTDQKEAYRSHLYYKLIRSGYNIDFVGSRNDGYGVEPEFDSDHEGWPGWTAPRLRENIYGWLSENTPDIILLHIGTNGGNWEEKPAELEDLLDEIDHFETEQHHSIIILLAKIIQRKPYDENTAVYNQEIEQIAQNRILNGDKIILVDMPAKAGFTDEDFYDRLHPNKIGYAKMADVWYDALTEILEIGFFALFSAKPLYITPDQTSTLSWEVFGKELAELFLDNIPVPSKGSMEVSPDTTTEYTLRGKAVDCTELKNVLTVNVVDIDTIHMLINSWGPGNEEVPGDIIADDGTVWKSSLPYLTSGGRFFDFDPYTDLTGPINYDELVNPAPLAAYFTVTHTNHSYSFPMLPNGVYTIRLHFFDIFGGSRAMNYIIEDRKILDGMGTSKNNAAIVESPVEITDDNGLQIIADKGTGNDVFESAIEIIGSPDAIPSVQFTSRTQTAYEGIRHTLKMQYSLSEMVEKNIEHTGLKNSLLQQISSSIDYTKNNQQEQSIETLKRLLAFIRTTWVTDLINNQAVQTELETMTENCLTSVINRVEIIASLSHNTVHDVSVQLQVSGTAGPEDHTLGAGPVEIFIPAGSREGSITFNVIDDDIVEDDETIILTMDSPVNAMFVQNSSMTTQVITVMEDDVKIGGIRLDPVSRCMEGDMIHATVFDHRGRVYPYEESVTIEWDVQGAEFTQVNNRAIVLSGKSDGPVIIKVTLDTFSDTRTINLLSEETTWIRVNSGGPDVVDPRGRIWKNDTLYLVEGFEGSSYTSRNFKRPKNLEGLVDVAPQEVYTTVRHRYKRGGPAPEKKIFIPVPDGNYTVRIHFNDSNGATRLFSYWINDVLVLEDYTPAEETPYGDLGVSIEEFDVAVTNGSGINITSIGEADPYYDSFETAYEVISYGIPQQ
jgi:hypothetical protein